jgi:hypothetical protein
MTIIVDRDLSEQKPLNITGTRILCSDTGSAIGHLEFLLVLLVEEIGAQLQIPRVSAENGAHVR